MASDSNVLRQRYERVTILQCDPEAFPSTLARLSPASPQPRRIVLELEYPPENMAGMSRLLDTIEAHWPLARAQIIKSQNDPFDAAYAARPIEIRLPLGNDFKEIGERTQVTHLEDAGKHELAGWRLQEVEETEISLLVPHAQYSFVGSVFWTSHRQVQAEIQLRSDIRQHVVSHGLLRRLGCPVPHGEERTVRLHFRTGTGFRYLDCLLAPDEDEDHQPWVSFLSPDSKDFLQCAWQPFQREDERDAGNLVPGVPHVGLRVRQKR